MDRRDRLIFALSALLRSERETRFAFETCIASGVVDPETLQALLSDPIPIITRDDINYAEDFALNKHGLGGTN